MTKVQKDILIVAVSVIFFTTIIIWWASRPVKPTPKPKVILRLEDKNSPANNSNVESSRNDQPSEQINKRQNSETIKAVFNCDDSKSIQADFRNGQNSFVDLTLSDGRSAHLAQAISASGARYASPDEEFVFWNKGDMAFIEENGVTTFANCVTSGNDATISTDATTTVTSLANPASVNCEKKGGRLQIEKKPDGGEYGLCYFDDARACEEWAMLRDECPVGGVKTTGFDTEAQKFCAWSGGQTLAVENAVCTFKDGSTCPADVYYAGTCQKGENIKK